jgi:hypothetical protein
MVFFDVSKDWIILCPFSVPAALRGAEELSHYIDRLRLRAGPGSGTKPPAIQDAAAAAPEDSAPLILLNPGEGEPWRNGFTWRLGKDRLEIYGDSDRGLQNGIFDFLDALGIRWPEPGAEELPPPPGSGEYTLRDSRGRRPSAASPGDISRLAAGKKLKAKEREALIRWAARNRIDALVFSLRDRGQKRRSPQKGTPDAVEHYALIPEAGGWELSLLVPRRFFFFRRELFRMESGKRIRDFNFCPTNPETIALLKKEAARLFRALPKVRVIHLWPDRGREKTWCACPACRAFSAEDQYRIAINAAADVLAELAPQARISLYEAPDEEAGAEAKTSVPLRPNVFRLALLPQTI